MAVDVGLAEPVGAAREQLLGLVLLGQLAHGVVLGEVADVGECEVRTRVAKEAASAESVVVVGAVVVGDDGFTVISVITTRRVPSPAMYHK